MVCHPFFVFYASGSTVPSSPRHPSTDTPCHVLSHSGFSLVALQSLLLKACNYPSLTGLCHVACMVSRSQDTLYQSRCPRPPTPFVSFSFFTLIFCHPFQPRACRVAREDNSPNTNFSCQHCDVGLLPAILTSNLSYSLPILHLYSGC